MFVRTGGTWAQQARLSASDPAEFGRLGSSVALSGDTAVVGALTSEAGRYSESAYVFVRTGGTWGQQAKLVAIDATSLDQLGVSVSVSGDTAVAGAPYDGDDDGDGDGTQSGSAYVFVPGTAGPSVTVNQAAGQADPTATSPIRFDVVFSEPVTGFDAADVILSGTAAGPLTATVTGSGATYTVTVSGMTSRGTVIATIRAGAATDPATDPSFASTSSDNTVTYTTPVTPAAINLACTPGTTAGGAPTMSCTASSADGAVPLHFARVNDLTPGIQLRRRQPGTRRPSGWRPTVRSP